MLHQMLFDAVVAACAGATNERPTRFYHTWYGWTSKEVLHVGSTSGAREREVWHFPLQKNRGGSLYFKNKTGTAYVYAKPAPADELEREIFALNPYAKKIERVSAINAEMSLYGSGCSHDTQGRTWFAVLTDGKMETVFCAPVVTAHFNQFHVGCPTGPDTVRILGGTYAVQIERNKFGLQRVFVTPEANTRVVIHLIRADSALRKGDAGPAADLEEEGIALPETLKNSKTLEGERRKRFQERLGQYVMTEPVGLDYEVGCNADDGIPHLRIFRPGDTFLRGGSAYRKSVDENHPAVAQAIAWAKEEARRPDKLFGQVPWNPEVYADRVRGHLVHDLPEELRQV